MMNKVNEIGDKLALSLSFICAIHCFVMPILLALMPSLQLFACANNENVHLWMMFAILPTSLISLVVGCRKHKNFSFLMIASVGLLILAFSAIWGHQLFGCRYEKYVTLTGSAILSVAHIKNYLFCRRDNCDAHSHPSRA